MYAKLPSAHQTMYRQQPRTLTAAPHSPHYHGFCSSCCHPVSQCRCGHRDCRKVEKELLVNPQTTQIKPEQSGETGMHSLSKFGTRKVVSLIDLTDSLNTMGDEEKTGAEMEKLSTYTASANTSKLLREAVIATKIPYGLESSVIGGGCCVHLSIEYMPLVPVMAQLPSFTAVAVMDSQATVMAWGKIFTEPGHQIKECIISTNPGAYVWVAAVNAVSRVRWCETISC